MCDDLWTQQDAQVACRQLGFSGAFHATSFAQFGQGTGTIWMDQVSCVGKITNKQTNKQTNNNNNRDVQMLRNASKGGGGKQSLTVPTLIYFKLVKT